ncbi:hypothetical protein [Pseudozobellia sp. WGM2]|uniref:hypothetical protein n=1 Tax=Pseudozobellia sp. WGM2 TaxID=2787625 RepID=UPI001FD74A36|nr:hypothetical protein [Pseudozobellia sp. WGM2]
MKLKLQTLGKISFFAGALLIMSCGNDDGGIDPTMEPETEEPMDDPEMEEAITETASKIYELGSVDDPEISGTAKFITFSNDSTVVELDLENTADGNMYPAHIHFNTAAEGGDIAVDLESVDGADGTSSTHVTVLNEGTAITYEELIAYDGYINVHLSLADLGTLVAQGDIGQNELTGTSKEYTLDSVDDENIDGTAAFYERVNGEALAVIALNNTPAEGMHPGHIHQNTAAEGGDIAFTFNPVNGDTGISKTNVAALDDETLFGYAEVLNYDGYINIHLSTEELGVLIAQGDVGQNELSGESKEYALDSVDFPEIDGTVTFLERINGEALAVIMLNGTADGGVHPGHIHANSAAEGGDILFTFNSVVGATGMSKTNIASLDDDTVFGYDNILTVDGYINIHLSADNLGSLIAQGDIGANDGEDEMGEAINFDVTNNGVTTYVFNSDNLDGEENPDLTLTRGQTYTFAVNASGHPFFIKTVQGNSQANSYDTGVTNNGAQDGTIIFVVPLDAPDTLFYNCQFHSVMTGTINIID